MHGNGNHGGIMLPSISGGAPGGPTLSGQSPGTRKRHFSFQPISDRQGSCPQSPSASPFISPRSTPVPMMRSRHSSGSALPLHLLPGGGPKGGGPGVLGMGGILFNSSSSDISRAATFGSASGNLKSFFLECFNSKCPKTGLILESQTSTRPFFI